MRKRRRPTKKTSWLKKILWGAIILLIALVLAVGTLFILHRSNITANTNVKEVKQETADTPIYILIAGVDRQTPAAADSVSLLCINWEKEKVFLITMPANTAMNPKDENGRVFLADTYRNGGVEELKSQVENLFHIFVPYYVVIDEDAVIKWIDKRGPIGLYVEKDMFHEDEEGLDINLAKGYSDLNGVDSLAYLRYKENVRGDLARVQRQQRFMKMYLHNFQKQYAWLNALYVYRSWDMVTSNIDAYDAMKIAYHLTRIPPQRIAFYILPGTEDSVEGKRFWEVDPIGAQNIIGEMLRDDLK